MNTETRPDRWVIVKMKSKQDTSYHILSSWGGSYMYGPSWKFSSMIKEIEKTTDIEFKVQTASGSTYILDTLDQTLSGTISAVYEQIKNNRKNTRCSIVDIEEPYKVMA
ncbi:hypothetical protein [Synechococcus phage BUCT-ZZ01]|nr:hypothetical protein [Synechococcus phage BUCT-ZZ01]